MEGLRERGQRPEVLTTERTVLPRERRLHADRDWDALFKGGPGTSGARESAGSAGASGGPDAPARIGGFGVSGPILSLRLRHTPGMRRVGVSVGRKVGGAVVRNRLKRRLRALARAHWDDLPEADVAILARPAAAALDYAGLETALLELAGRAARRLSGVEAPR